MSLRNHNWLDVIKTLAKFEYFVERQRGSHIILRDKKGNTITVPRHSPIKESTLDPMRNWPKSQLSHGFASRKIIQIINLFNYAYDLLKIILGQAKIQKDDFLKRI